MKFYEQIEGSTIEAEDFVSHGQHIGTQKIGNVQIAPGANTYPIVLKPNVAGTLIATSELFANAAWKSSARVIVPALPTQRVVLGSVIKSELQGLVGNTFAFTADLQPFANLNTNGPTSDSPPYSIQLAVANCAQACNVFITLNST